MLSAELYHQCYLLIITALTVIICLFYEQLKNAKGFSVFLAIFMMLFIGFRPISGVFIDMGNYHETFEHFKGLNPHFNFETENFIFSNIFSAFMMFQWPEEVFYFIIAVIYFGGIIWACLKLFPNHTLFSFVVYLAAFSTFSYGTNGIKSGAAASVFLLAVAYKDNKWLAALFALISLGFHHSMMLPIGAFVLAYFIKDPRYTFRFWIICFIIAALHITIFQDAFAYFTNESSSNYLIISEESGKQYLTGFRLDFILYSVVPIIIHKLLRMNYIVNSSQYDFIINFYTLSNAIWMLCMYASFTNRIAYLSWFIYPIALIYPFCNLKGIQNQGFYTLFVALAHLSFTLFMTYVYYA